ncbi:MAG: glycosyltransferase [Clostridia bacterium]|nr:glycosyltransferase [Clostridia bacterium]
MERKSPLVTLVVPIYNVEKYLDECLNSCQRQTLKDIEIICVDDGSKDKSFAIAQKHAKKDKRIVCITKPNAGYGNSMNIGFDKARGEYVGIAESDDYIAPGMCEILYKKAKQFNLDVIKSDYYTFTSKGGKKNKQYEPTCSDTKYYNTVLSPKQNKEMFTFQMNTWTGLYRNEFIRENNIRHNETPGASYQDNGFWFQTLSLAKSVMFVDKAFYHYRQDNPNSSINSKGKVFCMNDEYKFIHEFIMAHEDVKANFIEQYFNKMFFNYMHTYERISEEYRLSFLERFSEELNEAQRSGEISFNKIKDEWIRNMCLRIADDPQKFYLEDTTFRLKNYLNDAYARLDKLEHSLELKKGRKIAAILGRS